LPKLTHQQN